MKAGRPVYTKALPTLADGLAVPEVHLLPLFHTACMYCIYMIVCYYFPTIIQCIMQVGENAFACAEPRVDRMVVVTERDIAVAILRLVEIEKSVVEGAGASGLAACLSGQLDHLRGKK